MATYTAQTKNTASYSAQSNSGIIIAPGYSMGLLLALTYATEQRNSYTAEAKNTASYSAQTKN